jgi:hypothetical protein
MSNEPQIYENIIDRVHLQCYYFITSLRVHILVMAYSHTIVNRNGGMPA